MTRARPADARTAARLDQAKRAPGAASSCIACGKEDRVEGDEIGADCYRVLYSRRDLNASADPPMVAAAEEVLGGNRK